MVAELTRFAQLLRWPLPSPASSTVPQTGKEGDRAGVVLAGVGWSCWRGKALPPAASPQRGQSLRHKATDISLSPVTVLLHLLCPCSRLGTDVYQNVHTPPLELGLDGSPCFWTLRVQLHQHLSLDQENMNNLGERTCKMSDKQALRTNENSALLWDTDSLK